MSAIARKKSDRPRTLLPRVKLWLEVDGEHVFCSGLCQMLEAIGRTGSIKDAAGEIGKSYRYVWNKIKEAETNLGQKLVDARVGGMASQRSSLTPRARQLVRRFLALRAEIHAIVDAADWIVTL